MAGNATADRFDYETNLSRAGSYSRYRSAYWPPAAALHISCLDLAAAGAGINAELRRSLAALKTAIEAEWTSGKNSGVAGRRRFNEPLPIADVLREASGHVRSEADRRALTLRASAVQEGYNDDILEELAKLEEDVTLVAGQISTWYGKEVRGRPTAFGCRRDDSLQSWVSQALQGMDEVRSHLMRLHADLRCGDLPAFGACQLFFMAGEGSLHPKHIAYFLPEDEGVKYSPFKKTYYFANAHRAMLTHIGAPLADRILRIDGRFDIAAEGLDVIPTLGVLSHELGHFVHRPDTNFKTLNGTDRWASVALQEVAADVFGILILLEVWGQQLGLSRADIVAYYLAECLRYVDRGVGYFPDSDGMYLQLSYLVQLGALTVEDSGQLVGSSEVVIAGLRSLARVLADTLLAPDQAQRAHALHQSFGPANPNPLRRLIEELSRCPAGSIEYTQEYIYDIESSGV